jgi:hypothetical protein
MKGVKEKKNMEARSGGEQRSERGKELWKLK